MVFRHFFACQYFGIFSISPWISLRLWSITMVTRYSKRVVQLYLTITTFIFQFDGAAGERLCHASSVFASNQAKADRLFKVNTYITSLPEPVIGHNTCLIVPYSRKLWGRKLSQIGEKIWFSWRKLSWIAHFCHTKEHHTPKFCR